MPVVIQRVEAGVYVCKLSGTVGLDAILDTQRQGMQLAQQHNDTHYVLILDIDKSTQMPFDIRQSGKVLENNRAVAILTVGASFHIRFVASVLGRMFSLGIVEHLNKVEDAVKRARGILQKRT